MYLCMYVCMYVHSAKKKSRLARFDTTREIFHLICSFKNYHKQFYYAQFEYSQSLRFDVIFIIKRVGFIEQGAGKNSDSFLQWGDKALHCVYAVYFCFIQYQTQLVVQCHALKRYYIGLSTKSATLLFCTIFHKLRDFTVKFVSLGLWV